MRKQQKGFVYNVRLGLVQRNGLHLMCARLGMNFSQVVTLALDDYLRRKLRQGEYNSLDDTEYANHLIGESVNANRGVWGYDAQMNPIPKSMRYLLLNNQDEDSME